MGEAWRSLAPLELGALLPDSSRHGPLKFRALYLTHGSLCPRDKPLYSSPAPQEHFCSLPSQLGAPDPPLSLHRVLLELPTLRP